MFESGSNLGLHMEKVEFHSHSKFNRLNIFQDWQVLVLLLDSIMYEGIKLHLIKITKPFMCPDVGGIYCWTPPSWPSQKCTLHSRQNHWLGILIFFYHILRLGLTYFIKIGWCWLMSLAGSFLYGAYKNNVDLVE